jgi:hypothetical protein
MVASVPDDTARTISIDGTAARSASANLTSTSVGAPNEKIAMPVAEDQRAPTADQIEVAIAVDVPDRRAVALRDEHGIGADGPAGAHRRVDPSGDDGLRTLEDLLAALCRHGGGT